MTARELFIFIDNLIYGMAQDAEGNVDKAYKIYQESLIKEGGLDPDITFKQFIKARERLRAYTHIREKINEIERQFNILDQNEVDIQPIIKRHLKIESDTPGIVDFKFTLMDEADDDYIDFRKWAEQDPDLKAEIEKYTYKRKD